MELQVAAREIKPSAAQFLGTLFAKAYALLAAVGPLFVKAWVGAWNLGDRIGRLIKREPSGPESVEYVLRMARYYERTQPGFAADLRAAACRYDPELDR
ncbi:hypothetical protein C1702_16780 [Caldimonas thermodepolymerans]|uniref:Uncharacterized protein n=1 Tax=Caldimonas thermodepolymerans TaxID=215580 RepID=A0A2S5T0P0_9BURK|nr:hypothetical protein C1702_16780 [Caldimonas thermodepolymerans]